MNLEEDKIITEFMGRKYNPEAIYLYHKRWEELMPVVEKVKSLNTNPQTIKVAYLFGKLNWALMEAKIDAIFSAALEIIKYYANAPK